MFERTKEATDLARVCMANGAAWGHDQTESLRKAEAAGVTVFDFLHAYMDLEIGVPESRKEEDGE